MVIADLGTETAPLILPGFTQPKAEISAKSLAGREFIGRYRRPLQKPIIEKSGSLIVSATAPSGEDVVLKMSRRSQLTDVRRQIEEAKLQGEVAVVTPYVPKVIEVARISVERDLEAEQDDSSEGMYPMIVMQYLNGPTMHQLIFDTANRLEVPRAMDILASAASALDAMHEIRIVHMDIKPSNIVIYNGEAYVIDFGEAVREGVRLQGGFSATEGYIAPAQIENTKEDYTARREDDNWKFALMVLESITGNKVVEERIIQEDLSKFTKGEYYAYLRRRISGFDLPPSIQKLFVDVLTTEEGESRFTNSELIQKVKNEQQSFAADIGGRFKSLLGFGVLKTLKNVA